EEDRLPVEVRAVRRLDDPDQVLLVCAHAFLARHSSVAQCHSARACGASRSIRWKALGNFFGVILPQRGKNLLHRVNAGVNSASFVLAHLLVGGRTPCPVTPSSNWGWTWIMVQAPPKRKKSIPGAPLSQRNARTFSVSVMGPLCGYPSHHRSRSGRAARRPRAYRADASTLHR